MKLSLNPEASKRFDQRADELLKRVRPVPEELIKKPGPPNPNIHTVYSFTPENIIGEMTFGWSDFTGAGKGQGFAEGGKIVGLFEDDYALLLEIAEAMQRVIKPHNVVSVRRISDLIVEWIKLRYRSITEQPLTAFVLPECEKVIKEREIWIPISRFYIPMPFLFGKVTFKAITKQMIDDWYDRALSKGTEHKESIDKGFEQIRKAIQGLAAAIMTVEAEPAQGFEICSAEVERTVGILRFFWYGNLHPTKICYSAPLGSQHEDSYRYLVVEDGKIIGHTNGFSDRSRLQWSLKREDFETWAPELGILNMLLLSEKRTDFQDALLDGLILYSRSFLAKHVADRLIYMFAALESIFLKDSGELIQENISLRMAYMHDVSVDNRKNIMANIKRVYKLRSAFVHHGQTIDENDMVTLSEFMKNAWLSVAALILLAPSNPTKSDFFNYLENRRLGG